MKTALAASLLLATSALASSVDSKGCCPTKDGYCCSGNCACTKLTSSAVDPSVQLFEWSWSDVAYECENFLSKKGFKTVQISPPMEHIQGSQWWTRYQPVSYNLISRSGNETQFKDMVSRCNKVGVGIIVDAVINHMAAGSGTGTGGTTYGNRAYSGTYSQNDFHHTSNNANSNCQVTNYNDKYNVQYCDLVGLPDLLTSSSYVQSTIAGYINKMAGYGITGIRIDAAKHQDAAEMSGYISKFVPGLYINQEVIGSSGEAVQPYMYYSLGHVTEFAYATQLDPNLLNENKMTYLDTFGEAWGLMPSSSACAFLDNHDTQRNGQAQITYKNGPMYTFANLFMLAWNYGDVRVMSSYYFTNTDAGPPSVGVNAGANCANGKDWVCEHRIAGVANMIQWRNVAGKNAKVDNFQRGNSNQIAFSRGGSAFIALNRENYNTWNANLQTGLPAGTYCNVIHTLDSDKAASCPQTVVVGSDGRANVSVPPIYGVALHTNAKK